MEGTGNREQGTAVTFELNPAEIRMVLPLEQGGRKYRVTHFVRRPEYKELLAFRAAFARTMERINGAAVWSDCREAAAETLWNAIALRVEGYTLPEGADSWEQILWRELVPVSHKLLAADLFQRIGIVKPEIEEAFPLGQKSQTVYLEVRRDGLIYSNLAHVLREPGTHHLKEFRRINDTVLHVGGSRSDKTIFPSHLAELCGLYDELIVRVEGYAIDGRAPGDALEIAKWMDALHKEAAVNALFTPAVMIEDAAAGESEPRQ